jgi:hypothetical protein
MEKVDVVDEQTPTDSDVVDMLSPPTWGGYSRQPMFLSYTDKVRDSSPLTPIQPPPTKTFRIYCRVAGRLSLLNVKEKLGAIKVQLL